MGRKVPLIAAAVIAVVGAALVFLYAQGADGRAQDRFDTVDVLVATQQIEPGEAVNDAFTAGKVQLQAVAQGQVLPGATAKADDFSDLTAVTTIYPGEQLIPEKVGGTTDVETASTLPIPESLIAISVNLTDPARVAGFVSPGSQVAIFYTGTLEPAAGSNAVDVTRLLLPRVTVLGVGSTSQVTTTTTDETSGEQTTEQLPQTLLTIAVSQKEAERIFLADKDTELSLGLLTKSSKVKSARPVLEPELLK